MQNQGKRHEQTTGPAHRHDIRGGKHAVPRAARSIGLLTVLIVVVGLLLGHDFDGRAARSLVDATSVVDIGASSPVATLATPGANASPGATPATVGFGPLVIAGDPIVRLVSVRPGAPLYAAGNQGFYRSDNGGRSWRKAGPVPPSGEIVVAEDGPRLLLAGEPLACARGDTGVPLQRSGDGGATWQPVSGATGVWPLAIWRRAKLALGASCAGLQLSTDTGRTWKPLALPDGNDDVTAFAVLRGRGRPAALVGRTSEGGTSRLRVLDLGDPTHPVISNVLKEYWGLGALTGYQQVYVLGAADGVWVSIDGGANWKQRRNGLENVTLSVDPLREAIPDAEQQRGFGINIVVIDPVRRGDFYAGTSNGVYQSSGAGAKWERMAGVDGEVTGLALARRSGRLLVETKTGVVVVPLRSGR